MNKKIKLLLIVSLSLVLVGIAIITAAFFINGRNFSETDLLPVEIYEDKVLSFDLADFDNIEISVTSRNVTVKPSDNGRFWIETRESKNDRLSVAFNGKTTCISQWCDRKWYDFMGIRLNEKDDIIIYLPEEEYSSLSVKSTSGGVNVTGDLLFEKSSFELTSGSLMLGDGFNSDKTDVNNTSGSINISGLDGTSLYIHSTSGYKKLENVIESESLTVDSTSGEITLSGCDSKSIRIDSISGEVRCSLLTQKQFRANATSGTVSLPDISDDVNGTCEITTTSGNITVTVNE